MHISNDLPLARTVALGNPQYVLEAIKGLEAISGKEKRDGLLEVLYTSKIAKHITAAIGQLRDFSDECVIDGLIHLLTSSHNSVRLAAIGSLRDRRESRALLDVLHVLKTDGSWLVRRAALRALADVSDANQWVILHASDDPHWRVRHALIHVLLDWEVQRSASRQEIEQRLSELQTDATMYHRTASAIRIEGVLRYLRWRWTDDLDHVPELSLPEDVTQQSTLWDWDVYVLARNIRELGVFGRREHLALMPRFLAHPEEQVRRLASETLRKHGEAKHIADTVAVLDEPREDTRGVVNGLLGLLNLDRIEETVSCIFQLEHPSDAQLSWAIDQIDEDVSPVESEVRLLALAKDANELPPSVQAALIRCVVKNADNPDNVWTEFDASSFFERFFKSDESEVQLALLSAVRVKQPFAIPSDVLSHFWNSPDPHVRAEVAGILCSQKVKVSEVLLRQLASDVDARVRIRLAQALTMNQTNVSPAEEEFLVQLQCDDHPFVRGAAMPMTSATTENATIQGISASWSGTSFPDSIGSTAIEIRQLTNPHTTVTAKPVSKM